MFRPRAAPRRIRRGDKRPGPRDDRGYRYGRGRASRRAARPRATASASSQRPCPGPASSGTSPTKDNSHSPNSRASSSSMPTTGVTVATSNNSTAGSQTIAQLGVGHYQSRKPQPRRSHAARTMPDKPLRRVCAIRSRRSGEGGTITRRPLYHLKVSDDRGQLAVGNGS